MPLFLTLSKIAGEPSQITMVNLYWWIEDDRIFQHKCVGGTVVLLQERGRKMERKNWRIQFRKGCHQACQVMEQEGEVGLKVIGSVAEKEMVQGCVLTKSCYKFGLMRLKGGVG